ncbi:hypothetical protein HDE_01145 [Halotydeus destructor]|nr:hypothetical protein HDE_01145 [Halotydeus destructor]
MAAFEVVNFITGILASDEQFRTLQRLRYSTVAVAAVVAAILVMVKRTRMENLLANLQERLDDNDRKSLLKFGLKAILVYVVSTILLMVYYYEAYYPFDAKEDAETYFFYFLEDIQWYHVTFVYAVYTYQPLMTVHWHLVTMVLYLFVLKSYHCIHMKTISKMAAVNDFTQENMSNMAVALKKLNGIKKKFDVLFGEFPLLCFLVFFIRSSGIIASMSLSTQSKEAWAVVIFAYEASVLIGTVMMISKMEDDIQDDVDKLLLKLVSLSEGHCPVNLIMLIAILKEKVCLTGMEFFTINKPLLLSFTASLASFTVLFLQLSNN